MKTALQVVIIFTFFFTVGRLVAEQLPSGSAGTSDTVEQEVADEIPNIGQKDKRFTVDQLSVKVGDSVKFTNEDPFFHNVFSLSPASTFDLGSYPQGESRTIKFEEAGEVHIECAIHPSMRMVIEVEQ